MKWPLPQTRRTRVTSATVVFIGALAAAAPWVERWRPSSPDNFLTDRFSVTSDADAGPGTLREGIFAADRAGRAARVELKVARIVLESPLPPLLNPNGVIIDASRSHTQIVSRQGGEGPVIDVAAPHSAILGLRITGGAGTAVLARASDLKMRDVTIEDSAVGVYLVEGAGRLSVSDSFFRRNAVAIHLPGNIREVTIQNNRFERHRTAAIWAVAPSPLPVGTSVQLDVVHNQSSADSGPLVVVNVNARIEDNLFQNAGMSAAYVSGSTTTVIRRNRIRAGRGFGVEVIGIGSGLIADNEIDHNCAGGVLVRASHDTQIVSNRIYANGSGIVIVSGAGTPSRVTDNFVAHHQLDGLHLIGASPLVERNHLLQNQGTGLRMSRLSSNGRVVSMSQPHLLLNVVNGNGTDAETDAYEPGSATAATPPGDCAWRLGRGAAQLALQVVN